MSFKPILTYRFSLHPLPFPTFTCQGTHAVLPAEFLTICMVLITHSLWRSTRSSVYTGGFRPRSVSGFHYFVSSHWYSISKGPCSIILSYWLEWCLLRYNSHIKKSTILKCAIQGLLVYSPSFAIITMVYCGYCSLFSEFSELIL